MDKKIDYSHEVSLIKQPLVRALFMALSGILVLLGLLGIILPGLPTTPFILLAAYLFSKSSVRFYNWVMNHHLFGPSLRQWHETRSISRKTKIIATITILVTFTATIVFAIHSLPMRLLLASIGSTVMVFIITRREEPSNKGDKPKNINDL